MVRPEIAKSRDDLVAVRMAFDIGGEFRQHVCAQGDGNVENLAQQSIDPGSAFARRPELEPQEVPGRQGNLCDGIHLCKGLEEPSGYAKRTLVAVGKIPVRDWQSGYSERENLD